MKKLLLIAALFVAALGVNAQETENLEPTQLGKWMKPAKTGIAAVDAYIDHCAAMYQESMDIRKEYDALEKVDMTDATNAANASLGAEGTQNTLKAKAAEYNKILERIKNQQAPAEKIPSLLSDATTAASKAGLKLPACTKAIASTKNVIVLVTKENAGLLKATQAKLAAAK